VDPEEQKAKIQQLFTRIARRYDLLNRLMSLGQDQRWRAQAIASLQLPARARVLDVATGTGDVALMIQRQYPESEVIGLDLTPAMVAGAQAKDTQRRVAWCVGDGLALPFPAASFDGVISAFMLRNVPDVPMALREQVRVLKSGGRLACLEMTWPKRFPMAQLFSVYFFHWTPLMGRLLAGDEAAYRYLPRSVATFIPPDQVCHILRAVGLEEVQVQFQMGGTVALYTGWKP